MVQKISQKLDRKYIRRYLLSKWAYINCKSQNTIAVNLLWDTEFNLVRRNTDDQVHLNELANIVSNHKKVFNLLCKSNQLCLMWTQHMVTIDLIQECVDEFGQCLTTNKIGMHHFALELKR